MPNLNFRELLRETSTLGTFTSRSVAERLKRPVKEISNDFRRLHRMGFIKGEREERLCHLKGGNTCRKGWQLVYRLTKQGKSYLKWMNETKPYEDYAHMMLTDQVLAHLPPELGKSVLAYNAIKALSRFKGPSRRSGLFDDPVLSGAILMLENLRLKQLLQEDRKALWGIADLFLAHGLKQAENARERELEIAKTLGGFLSETRKNANATRSILISIINVLANIHKDSKMLLLNSLRKYAPSAEYVKTLELVASIERTGLDTIMLGLSIVEHTTQGARAQESRSLENEPPSGTD